MTRYRSAVEAGDVVIVPRNQLASERRRGWIDTLAAVGLVVVIWWSTR